VAVALGVAALGSPASAAAQSAPAPDGARVRVTGLVVDSLLGAPLAGATVTREGDSRVSFTDSAGRFELDSVPAGVSRFVFSHPGVDSVGLGEVPVAVTIAAGSPTATVRLATPSRATLRARVCAGGPAPARGAGDGVVFGEVRDAATGARLAGARAAVTWTVIDTTVRPFVIRAERRDVIADSLGGWSACGLPIADALEARAAAGRAESGRAAFALGPRGVARLDLWVSLRTATASAGSPPSAAAAAAAEASPAEASPAPAAAATPGTKEADGKAVGPGVLVGVVRDSLGAGRPGALVQLDGVGGLEARTDAEGRFRLAGLPLGTGTAVVRALGYAPQSMPVALRPSEPTELDVTLRRVVTLAGVEVRARVNRSGALAAEIARRQLLGVSQLLDTALARRTGQLRSALSAMPFVTVTTTPGAASDWSVQFMRRGTPCTARVFIDGFEVNWAMAQDLSPSVVSATEVFRDPNRIPPQYGGTSMTTECGAVFFWTRTAR
jgi:hypothetical protein